MGPETFESPLSQSFPSNTQQVPRNASSGTVRSQVQRLEQQQAAASQHNPFRRANAFGSDTRLASLSEGRPIGSGSFPAQHSPWAASDSLPVSMIGSENVSLGPRFPSFGERNSPEPQELSQEEPGFESLLRIRHSASSDEISFRRNSNWLDIEPDQGLEISSDNRRSGVRSGSISFGRLNMHRGVEIPGIAVQVYDSAHSRANTPFDPHPLSTRLLLPAVPHLSSTTGSEAIVSGAPILLRPRSRASTPLETRLSSSGLSLPHIPSLSPLASSEEVASGASMLAEPYAGAHSVFNAEAQREFSDLTLGQRIRQGLRASTATNQSTLSREFRIIESSRPTATLALDNHGQSFQEFEPAFTESGRSVYELEAVEGRQQSGHHERSTAGRTPPLQTLGFGRPPTRHGPPRIDTLFAGSTSAETSNTVTDSRGDGAAVRRTSAENTEDAEDNDWETDIGSHAVPESRLAYTGLDVPRTGSSLADNSDSGSLSPPKQSTSLFPNRPILSHPPHPRYASSAVTLPVNQPGGAIALIPNYPPTLQTTLSPRDRVVQSQLGRFQNADVRPEAASYRHPSPLRAGHEHPFRSSPPSFTSSRRAELSSTSLGTSRTANVETQGPVVYRSETMQLAGNRRRALRRERERAEMPEEVQVSSSASP